MKNKMKRVLAFVVAFAMVFTLMPGNYRVSRAAGDPINVGEGDYIQNNEVVIPSDSFPDRSSFDSVEVPDGYMFTVDNACTGCTINKLTFKGPESRVNIFGKLTVTTVEPVEGAQIAVYGENCDITGIALLNEDGSPYVHSGAWNEFEYRNNNGEYGWYLKTNTIVSYGPLWFDINNLHREGEVKVSIKNETRNINIEFLVDAPETSPNVLDGYSLSAGDIITIYADCPELRHLGYDFGNGEDQLNDETRGQAVREAMSPNGHKIVIPSSSNIENLNIIMDLQRGEGNDDIADGEVGILVWREGEGEITVDSTNQDVQIREIENYWSGHLYIFNEADVESISVTITPEQGNKVAETLSYANDEIFTKIDTSGTEGFREKNGETLTGTYIFNIKSIMFDLDDSDGTFKNIVPIDVTFISENDNEMDGKGELGEGLENREMPNKVTSEFIVRGKASNAVQVGVSPLEGNHMITMVNKCIDENFEKYLEKYYRTYKSFPYTYSLGSEGENGTNNGVPGYYSCVRDENNNGKVTLEFKHNFMYRIERLIINGVEYGVAEKEVTTYGRDEVVFTDLYGKNAKRDVLLRAFVDQDYGCKVKVDYATKYDIEIDLIPVDGYFTERDDGKRYGDDVVIGNFLWFPTGGHAEDDAMTNGHLEIVSYEVSEADADALGISKELRKGTIEDNIGSDKSFGTPGTSFYFHSPSDGSDGNTRENGEAVFPVGTKLVCKLVPDYGYQLAEFSVNGDPLTPLKEVSTFEYTVGQGNFHFGAKFVPAENKLDCKASENVSAVTIANDENAAESGTLALTVKDETTVDKEVTSKYDGAISTIDLTLVNEVKKSETEYWETPISEFENPVTISLTLDPTEFTEDSYKVVRNHITKDSNNVETSVVEELENVSYDNATGKLSFETNKFSAYTIVRIAAEKVTLSKTSHKFTTIGDTVAVTATVTPDAVEDKSVTWSSADKSIATVDENGLITAVSNGVTMITATSNDNKNVSASMTVEVVADVETKEVEKEVIEDGTNPGTVSVETQIPASVKESITISDFNTSTTKEQLSSEELSEVRNDGVNAKISLYVTSLSSVPSTEADKVDTAKESLPIAKEEVKEIMKLDLSMYKQVGDEAERLTEITKPIKIEIAIPPDAILNDTTKTRHYFMIDVHNGVATLTPLKNNTGKLVVERSKFSTLVIGYYDTTNVTNVTISGDTATLTEAGATTTLTATITPADATEKGITWSSSNTAVATVDETGKVTAVANGTATIKATSKDNVAVYGETEITVSIPSPCTHTETVVKDTKEATCISDGYTGDTYCKSCGTKISSGTAIKAAGHKYDAGKVTKEPTVDAEGVKTYTCTVCGATKTEAIAKLPKPETPAVNVSYHTHIQTLGDSQGVKTNGQMAGTSGQSKRLENIWIKVDGNSNLGIQYSTHCQSYGWMPWSANGEANGTSGESKRLEAIKIRLTGADADKYDVYYRVHAQNYGWLAWVSNGAPSGTAGCSLRLEGIQVVVVKKGEAAPGLDYADVKASTGVYNSQGYINKSSSEIVIPGSENTPNVSYRTHVQSIGWQGWKLNGDMSGTSGQSKRLEGINIKLSNCGYEGGIRYMTHIQTYGWSQGWKKDGEMAGTSGESKRLEAIKIELTGEMANHYDIYYRVHAQSYGWLAWAKNGESAGTEGLSKRLEGIQIVLVPKGAEAPSANYSNIQSTQSQACIK